MRRRVGRGSGKCQRAVYRDLRTRSRPTQPSLGNARVAHSSKLNSKIVRVKCAEKVRSHVPALQGPFRRARESADTNFESSRDGAPLRRSGAADGASPSKSVSRSTMPCSRNGSGVRSSVRVPRSRSPISLQIARR